MALVLRGENYWMDVQINGKRLRESLKTGDKKLAQQLHDMRKAELWREGVLKEKPKKTFKEACARWVIERAHKRSMADDQLKIKFLLPKIGTTLLSELTRDKIESVLPKEVSGATRNRYRALIGPCCVLLNASGTGSIAPLCSEPRQNQSAASHI